MESSNEMYNAPVMVVRNDSEHASVNGVRKGVQPLPKILDCHRVL